VVAALVLVLVLVLVVPEISTSEAADEVIQHQFPASIKCLQSEFSDSPDFFVPSCTIIIIIISSSILAFRAMTLLDGRQEGHLACRN